jgi:hypothetical protein
MERGAAISGVRIDAAWIGQKRPEQPARKRVDARVKVMNLAGWVGAADGTPGVKVQSDEAYRAAMDLAVHPDVDAIHEPAVIIEYQPLRPTRIDAGASPSHMGESDNPVEVCDCRGFLS